jgi:hypothetical protein
MTQQDLDIIGKVEQAKKNFIKRSKAFFTADPYRPIVSPLDPSNIYKTGDGDVIQARRLWADDHKKHTSRIGGAQVQYKDRGHE